MTHNIDIQPEVLSEQAPDQTSDAMPDRSLEHQRMVEAVLFAAETPLSVSDIEDRLPGGAEIERHIDALIIDYANKGVNLVRVAGKYMFRTADDLSFLLRREVDEPRKLSRAGVETLAIIAYHQPVTRAEIEDIRGVTISKGTLDVLMEAGWVRMLGRRKTPGRPVTYGTSEEFLVHFGIETIKDLPGLQDLKAAGLLDSVDTALDKMGGMPGPSTADGEEEDGEGEADQIDLEDAIADSERNEASDSGADAGNDTVEEVLTDTADDDKIDT